MSTVIFFNSCSSNDDSADGSTEKLLLSKVTTIYYDNPYKPETIVATLEYNNLGELIKTISQERATTFEYNNGKPVRANYYNKKQELEYYAAFSYNGNLLTSIKAIYPSPDLNRTSYYTYNANSQLISSNLCESEDCTHPSITSYSYDGNNISSLTLVIGGSNYNNKREFSYDNKLNPYTNINKYLRITMERTYTLSNSNYIIDKNSYKDNDGSWKPSETTTYSIQYNDAGFPVQAIGKGSDGNLSVQYNYEYIIK